MKTTLGGYQSQELSGNKKRLLMFIFVCNRLFLVWMWRVAGIYDLVTRLTGKT